MANHSARRSHYLSASYLAGFTTTGKKDGQFYVMEVESGRSFRTSPKNVAVKRDFNRVNIEGVAPDAIEQALAPFEQQAVQAIANVLESETFPKDKDYNLILNFLCLFAVRNPSLRGSFNRAREQVLRTIADLLVSDKRIWDQHTRAAGISSERLPAVSFEEMRRFVKGGRYRFEFPTDGNLVAEFDIFDKVLPLLGERNWSLLLAPAGGPDLICSDRPVALTWKARRQKPIGFALRGTEVFFPLGRRAGFYGVFEDPLPLIVELKPRLVASMNERVARSAERHVYSAEPAFVLLHEGKIREVNCVSNGPG